MAETRVDKVEAECAGDGEAVYDYLFLDGQVVKRGNVLRGIEDIKLVLDGDVKEDRARAVI